MEIERINENTVKLYISYGDIEERGFDREEIWYNREKSEELFWEMMEEIHNEDDFIADGPLWIQIQALDKGLEVLVTKAQLSRDGQRLELPIPEDKQGQLPVDHTVEDFLDQTFQLKPYDQAELVDFEFVIQFTDLEDLLALVSRQDLVDYETTLFSFSDQYYLYINFSDENFNEDQIENALSILLEYGEESSYTVHYLVEYGKTVIDHDVFTTLNHYFK